MFNLLFNLQNNIQNLCLSLKSNLTSYIERNETNIGLPKFQEIFLTNLNYRAFPREWPKVTKLRFWSQNMLNVLKCMQKQFFDFNIFFSLNWIFLLSFSDLRFFDKKFRRKTIVHRFWWSSDLHTFRRF